MRYNVLSFSLDALSGAVEAIGIAVILWIGFYSVRANIITIGKLITFYSLLSSFIEPIKNIINLQPTIQAAVIAAERINDILDLDIEDSASSSTTTLKAIDLLEVKNVSFRYGNGLLVLENVALSIKRGEKICYSWTKWLWKVNSCQVVPPILSSGIRAHPNKWNKH